MHNKYFFVDRRLESFSPEVEVVATDLNMAILLLNMEKGVAAHNFRFERSEWDLNGRTNLNANIFLPSPNYSTKNT